MFYESERIVRKNENYEKTKAYAVISELESKGLSVQESISMIDVLLKDTPTESMASSLEKAKNLLLNRMKPHEKTLEINSSNRFNNPDLICPLIVYSRQRKSE